MENPFAALRPGMRSEHDEIRKGIFSRALRNLQQAPLAERRAWCIAIRAAYTPKQKCAAAATATTLGANQQLAPSTPSSLSTSTTSSTPGATASCTSSSASSSPITGVGEKRTHAEMAADADDHTAPSSSQTTTAPAAEVAEESEEAVKECIAAFLRNLLDRVVGMSLESLKVPSLRILCTMVGIKTEVRNKIGLYSTLASFYYTECEKLGKRVSRDTVFDRHVDQEVAMLKHVVPSSSAAASGRKAGGRTAGTTISTAGERNKTSSASEASPASSTTRSAKAATTTAAPLKAVRASSTFDGGATVLKARTASSEAEDKTTAARVGKTRRTRADLDMDRYLRYEHYDEGDLYEEVEGDTVKVAMTSYGTEEGDVQEDGEVVYNSRVFSHGGNGSSSAHMTKYESPAEEDETWTVPMLERKVASIVQLHDPVTVSIVVKKLAQLGYRESGAEAMVEAMLRRFHERQLIFYDNGIAYLM